MCTCSIGEGLPPGLAGADDTRTEEQKPIAPTVVVIACRGVQVTEPAVQQRRNTQGVCAVLAMPFTWKAFGRG